MKPPRIDAARLEAFTVAYVPAVLAAVQDVKPWLGGLSADTSALSDFLAGK